MGGRCGLSGGAIGPRLGVVKAIAGSEANGFVFNDVIGAVIDSEGETWEQNKQTDIKKLRVPQPGMDLCLRSE